MSDFVTIRSDSGAIVRLRLSSITAVMGRYTATNRGVHIEVAGATWEIACDTVNEVVVWVDRLTRDNRVESLEDASTPTATWSGVATDVPHRRTKQ